MVGYSDGAEFIGGEEVSLGISMAVRLVNVMSRAVRVVYHHKTSAWVLDRPTPHPT